MEVSESTITANFDTEVLNVEEKMDTFIYYNIGREFIKQGARIESVICAESGVTVSLETTSDPVSAENRQTFRVSTIMGNVTATFGSEDDCSVVDLSAQGFALYSKEKYVVGNRIATVLHYEREKLKGTVGIVSIDERRKGYLRYGVLCINDDKGDNLERKLPRVSTAVERRQLARRARLE